MTTAVYSSDGPYIAAIAELPLSAYRSSRVAGSIVVLSGGVGWSNHLAGAVTDGALEIVVSDPHTDDADEIFAALASLPEVSIVVDRPLLRSDLVDDVRQFGTSAPILVQVECSGSGAEFATVARDALGWARVLAGGQPELTSSRSTPRGFSALLTVPASVRSPQIYVTVLATRRQGTAPWIRAVALGTERIEVTIDLARRSAIVARAAESGRTVQPTRWESAERVVLRRALDVPVGRNEIAELLLDTCLVARADHADPIG